MDKKEQRLMVLKTICQVFVMNDQQKWQYLDRGRPWMPLMFNEAGDTTDEPLKFFCNAAYECTENFRDKSDEVLAGLVRDLSTLLNTIIQMNLSYVWQDPRTRLISGDPDRLWLVIRRLAALILEHRGWSFDVPETPLHKLTWAGTIKDTDSSVG